MMYYVDSQRTLTRRDSSLLLSKRSEIDDEFDIKSTARGSSTVRLTSDDTSLPFAVSRPKGLVQKELVTSLFESMLSSITESWNILNSFKQEEAPVKIEKTPSELTNKKKKTVAKTSKTKKSRSKMELNESNMQTNPLNQVWWNGPDERVVIKFKNGNLYEGNISMKSMHGEGRFQWANGTVYLGQFKDNKMTGKGLIKWKDDTWYEGDFNDNLRHGNGLYVNSRHQRCFLGEWDCGTKHGKGIIHYSETFKNSYDGQWNHNVRHGFGSREYSTTSGYKGEWDRYLREGKGLMIWPNHDFYSGEWKSGIMSGYGIYIWNAFYNDSFSLPSINIYRGFWVKGQRNGYGLLTLGLGSGSHYRGEFKNNMKNGIGKFVTNNGLVLQHRNLFTDDNLRAIASDENINGSSVKQYQDIEPFEFNMYDKHTIGLTYHIEEAMRNLEKGKETRSKIIYDYFVNNISQISYEFNKNNTSNDIYSSNLENFMKFEVDSLQKTLRCYETELKMIYYKYAMIFNNEEINFTPVLIRLSLWQLYYDCNVHDKGLTLVEIDKIFHNNPQWLARTLHNPFEEIYFWQFLHSLISVASTLYTMKELPKVKPETLLSTAFRLFMDHDVLPNVGKRKGKLANEYVNYIPLKETYELYKEIGEPHTVRKFLCTIRRSIHILDNSEPEPQIVEPSKEALPIGRNVFVFSDELTFLSDNNFNSNEEKVAFWENNKYKLFNFADLPLKVVLKIFANIFPDLYDKNTAKIRKLDINMTFFEFFEAFVTCAEESIARNNRSDAEY